MTPPLISKDEERVESLRALRILDTPASEMFDRITALAAELFDAQVALISLVDAERQWFLSRHGFDVCETPREIAFCSHTIAAKNVLPVPDTRADERFASNPFVTGKPHFRSYLGYPIESPDGAPIGTLCVLDSRPNHFEGCNFGKLEALAKTVEVLLAAHKKSLENDEMAIALESKNMTLARANGIFQQAENAARIGSWEVDCGTLELSWSDGVYVMHGIEPGTPITVEDAINAYVPADRSLVERTIRNAIVDREPFHFEADMISRSGETVRIQGRGEFLLGDGNLSDRLVGVVQDITESHHAKAALQHAADFDSLTDLYNRHALDRILGETIKRQRAGAETIAVLLLDLDGFKAINDTFGHLIGDMVLEEISGRLTRCLSEDIVAARWGGDEFVFIPPLGCDRDYIERLWSRLSEAVKKPFTISGRKLVLHATGGTEISRDVIGGRELVRRADLAMYDAKKRNSGSLRFYGEDLERDNKEKQEAIAQVREAIDAGRLYAAYQPIVDLLTDEVVGLEALMRFHNRQNIELAAANVMPAILDPHISREIGEEMVSFICADHGEVAGALDDLRYISINATEADLLSRNYASNLLAKLEQAGIDPSRVTLEVTETMLMVNDYENARRVLCELSDAGMQIALDDFGTGYSSLTHLRDFPIDIVKIDKSFVNSVCSTHQSRLIIQALIAMARNLDIQVIAEGIERESQRELLMHMGCRYGQGYLLGMPQTSAKFSVAKLRNATGSFHGPNRPDDARSDNDSTRDRRDAG
ncbi:MAG: EAL domain-containing protein [Erythrobacter sp.]